MSDIVQNLLSNPTSLAAIMHLSSNGNMSIGQAMVGAAQHVQQQQDMDFKRQQMQRAVAAQEAMPRLIQMVDLSNPVASFQKLITLGVPADMAKEVIGTAVDAAKEQRLNQSQQMLQQMLTGSPGADASAAQSGAGSSNNTSQPDYGAGNQITPPNGYAWDRDGGLSPVDQSGKPIALDTSTQPSGASIPRPASGVIPGGQAGKLMAFGAMTGNPQAMQLGTTLFQSQQHANDQAIAEQNRTADIARQDAQRKQDRNNKVADTDAANLREDNKTNDTERQAAGYADRMIANNQILTGLESKGYNPASATENARAAVPGVGNYLATPENQQYHQAQEDWVRAKLRKESGAVISPSEMQGEIDTYFPKPGDTKKTIEQKVAARERAQSAMARNAGKTYAAPGASNGIKFLGFE